MKIWRGGRGELGIGEEGKGYTVLVSCVFLFYFIFRLPWSERRDGWERVHSDGGIGKRAGSGFP